MEGLEKLDSGRHDIIVVANNAQEMQVAQASLVSNFGQKVDRLLAERDDAIKNVEAAQKNKWKVQPFRNVLNRIEKEVRFYEKIKAALEAGYVIVPNFDEIDIFAIRTTKKNVDQNITEGTQYGVRKPDQQESNNPALGAGTYVNADAVFKNYAKTVQFQDGSRREIQMSKAVEFDDVDFPFRLTKPQVLERTSEAMQKLIFDDIGILPNRNIKRGDPMVIGRIFMKKGYTMKCCSFLITWFVNTADI